MSRFEKMNDIFYKIHNDDGTVHHFFSAPDFGPPHDHPWDFKSTVIKGGYTEEIYSLVDGSVEIAHRKRGDTFFVPKERVHRIIELPFGDCQTFVRPLHSGYPFRVWKFWDFNQDTPRWRYHNSDEWNEINV